MIPIVEAASEIFRFEVAKGELVSDGEGVAELDLALVDAACGEFQHALHVPMHGGDAPWNELLPELDDLVVFVEADDVNGALHADGMHAGGECDEEPFSGDDALFSQEADHADHGGARDVDEISDG